MKAVISRLTVACSSILGVSKVLMNIITPETHKHTGEHHEHHHHTPGTHKHTGEHHKHHDTWNSVTVVGSCCRTVTIVLCDRQLIVTVVLYDYG